MAWMEVGEPPFMGGSPFSGRHNSYHDLAEIISGMWMSFLNSGIPYYKNRKSGCCFWTLALLHYETAC
ncbi:hypothetical protein HZ326_21984 [Fusarium oxysporum f. sp. albedinis]|nr:hypothetical protein HZ326_21984 [Fusarium oxysporum f. sp. albedinis]